MIISEQRQKDIKQIIDMYFLGTSKLHDEYSHAYPVTNENISEVWDFFEFNENMKLLSVLASGDQIFDMISKGIKNVDTFDSNRVAEYYTLGFKKTAIENLGYYQFIEMLNHEKNGHNYEMEDYVISCAPEEYKKFWQELLYCLKQQGVKASVFDFSKGSGILEALLNNCCNYLKCPENYANLQQRLKTSNITFNYCDITQIPLECGQYDLIFLSNIFDYYRDIFRYPYMQESRNKALEFFQSIYDKNLNKPGEIILTFFEHTFITELLSNAVDKKITCTKKVLYPGAIGIQKGRVLRKNSWPAMEIK